MNLPQRKKPLIIVCDDEENVRESYKVVLEDKYDVGTAAGGEELLEKLKNMRAAAVILDVKMPGIDGVETLRRIRKAHPRLPVVMTSAYKLPEEAPRIGISGFIEKPFSACAVLSLIASILPE